ncbi:BA14K-like protein [Rhizobium sp. CF122]|uniref:BA14K family protein n=1 Tax=Rhizobium sp. CF122 TaxID=1144312 RepID=UPI000271A05E|nr:BA14K family protein [Rhizobium sp. CF122]EJL57297.1 BA14K-like protein [Rhizobium sp. CF122]
MNRLAKTLLMTATAAALTVSSISVASAGDWRRHHHNDDALVGGAVGLATGLIVGSAIASAPRYDEPRYIDPPYEPEYDAAPVYRAPPARYYRADVEPWTPQWERYCSYRYQSFDPRSGTYIGYDGRSHFCTAG